MRGSVPMARLQTTRGGAEKGRRLIIHGYGVSKLLHVSDAISIFITDYPGPWEAIASQYLYGSA
jgi:hypothetical protein